MKTMVAVAHFGNIEKCYRRVMCCADEGRHRDERGESAGTAAERQHVGTRLLSSFRVSTLGAFRCQRYHRRSTWFI